MDNRHRFGGRAIPPDITLLVRQDPHKFEVINEVASDDLQPYLSSLHYLRHIPVVTAPCPDPSTVAIIPPPIHSKWRRQYRAVFVTIGDSLKQLDGNFIRSNSFPFAKELIYRGLYSQSRVHR